METQTKHTPGPWEAYNGEVTTERRVMNEREYCEFYCGPLTPSQVIMLETMITQGCFLGVGRIQCSNVWGPLVHRLRRPSVIDRDGYHLEPELYSMRGYDWARDHGFQDERAAS